MVDACQVELGSTVIELVGSVLSEVAIFELVAAAVEQLQESEVYQKVIAKLPFGETFNQMAVQTAKLTNIIAKPIAKATGAIVKWFSCLGVNSCRYTN